MKHDIKIGERYGRLTVIDEAGKNKHNHRLVKCVCDCGKKNHIAIFSHVRAGRAESCGCLQRETIAKIGQNNTGNLVNCDWRKNERDTPVSRKYPEQVGKIRGSYANTVINTIRNQAKKRKLDWELDLLTAFELAIADCFYCGAACNWPANRNGIDRVDNTKGYLDGNVVSCCFRCNSAKNDMTLEDFKAFIFRIAARFSKA